jgi:hypothetical protein
MPSVIGTTDKFPLLIHEHAHRSERYASGV